MHHLFRHGTKMCRVWMITVHHLLMRFDAVMLHWMNILVQWVLNVCPFFWHFLWFHLLTSLKNLSKEFSCTEILKKTICSEFHKNSLKFFFFPLNIKSIFRFFTIRIFFYFFHPPSTTSRNILNWMLIIIQRNNTKMTTTSLRTVHTVK